MQQLDDKVCGVCGTVSINYGDVVSTIPTARIGDIVIIDFGSDALLDIRSDELVLCIVGVNASLHHSNNSKARGTSTFGCAVRVPRSTISLFTETQKRCAALLIRGGDIPTATNVVLYVESIACLTPGTRSLLAAAAIRAMAGWVITVGSRISLAWGGDITLSSSSSSSPSLYIHITVLRLTAPSASRSTYGCARIIADITNAAFATSKSTTTETPSKLDTEGGSGGSKNLSPWKKVAPQVYKSPLNSSSNTMASSASGSGSPRVKNNTDSSLSPSSSPLSPLKSPISSPNIILRESTTASRPNTPIATSSPPTTTTVHRPPQKPSAGAALCALPGLESVGATLLTALAWPLLPGASIAFSTLNLTPSRGILLCGPPGVGKTALVRATAIDASALLSPRIVRVIEPDARLLSDPNPDAPNRALRAVFKEAEMIVRNGGAAIIFFDEIDALAPSREGRGGVGEGDARASARRVAQLLTLLDGTATRVPHGVLIIGATNRPSAVDAALRRPGRFDTEVIVHPPNADARIRILSTATANLPLSDDARESLKSLAIAAVGTVGADLTAAVREAAGASLRRASQHHHHHHHHMITRSDLATALTRVGASSLRGAVGFIPSPPTSSSQTSSSPSNIATTSSSFADTAWSRVGGADAVVVRLREAIELPLRHSALFTKVGLSPPRGLLLFGPPGNAKTTLVTALAAALGAPLFCLSPADVLSAYVGEAEGILRRAFSSARSAAPSVLFLDEIDALVGGSAAREGGGVARGLLATLLTELDGVANGDCGILVVGATNRPNTLDPALLRPGRLSLHINVPAPDTAGRIAVLLIHSRLLPLANDVHFNTLAEKTEGWSGAKLEALCRSAAFVALREAVSLGFTQVKSVTAVHFEVALKSLD